MPDLTPGQRVIWRRSPRGGYGYIERIPAIIVRVGKRVTIEATLATGGTKRVSVRPENLRVPETTLEIQIAATAKSGYCNGCATHL